MIFNRDVLENFEESELEIVKCILFFIQEDIYINDMVTNKHHDLINDEVETLSWKDTILGDVQELVLKLRDLGIIVESYEKEKVRWKLKVPLYVDENAEPYEEKITDDLVSKCRQFFKKSYCRIAGRSGSNKTVKNALSLLLQNNPDIDVNLIPGACKLRIDTQLASIDAEHMIPGIMNFINPDGDTEWISKDLLCYLEEYEESGNEVEMRRDELI